MMHRPDITEIYVICRVGSLEMPALNGEFILDVICRVGSLEIVDKTNRYGYYVICRVGSLET